MAFITILSGISETTAGIIFLLNALFVLKKDPKYDLNRLFALALVFFSFLLISEGGMYILQSTNNNIINLLRDITEISGIIAGACLILAGVEVNSGKKWRSLQVLLPLIIIISIAIVGTMFHDVYYKEISNEYFYYYEGRFPFVFLLVSGIPIFELLLGLFLFNNVRIKVKETDAKIAKKMLFLQIGMVFILIAATFLVTMLTILVPSGTAPNIILVLLGHVGYLISSLFIFLAFK